MPKYWSFNFNYCLPILPSTLSIVGEWETEAANVVVSHRNLICSQPKSDKRDKLIRNTYTILNNETFLHGPELGNNKITEFQRSYNRNKNYNVYKWYIYTFVGDKWK